MPFFESVIASFVGSVLDRMSVRIFSEKQEKAGYVQLQREYEEQLKKAKDEMYLVFRQKDEYLERFIAAIRIKNVFVLMDSKSTGDFNGRQRGEVNKALGEPHIRESISILKRPWQFSADVPRQILDDAAALIGNYELYDGNWNKAVVNNCSTMLDRLDYSLKEVLEVTDG